MIMLREYKSVVFWLIFVSLWIIGCFPCCKEEDEDGIIVQENTRKDDTNPNYNNGNINYDSANNINNGLVNQNKNISNDYNNSNNDNINNINPQTNINHPTIFNEEIGFIAANINEEPMIGLGNIGAICYMNATLQCLSHTIKLSNYFLNEKYEKFIKSKKLSKGFLEVIKKLWIKSYNGNKSYYEPYNFKELISDMNPLFKGIQANDSKDLINFILQQLHIELNKAKSNQIIDLLNIDQTNENQMFINFLKEFKNNQKSIISDIFYFIVETKTECLNCKQKYQMMGFNNPIYLYNFQLNLKISLILLFIKFRSTALLKIFLGTVINICISDKFVNILFFSVTKHLPFKTSLL